MQLWHLFKLAPLPCSLMKFGCIINGHAFYTSTMGSINFYGVMPVKPRFSNQYPPSWLNISRVARLVHVSISGSTQPLQSWLQGYEYKLFFNAISPPFPRLVLSAQHRSGGIGHTKQARSLQHVMELVRLLYIINKASLLSQSKGLARLIVVQTLHRKQPCLPQRSKSQ